jgi:hypothetical protein
VLYQLSYSRLMSDKYKDIFFLCNFWIHFSQLFSSIWISSDSTAKLANGLSNQSKIRLLLTNIR